MERYPNEALENAIDVYKTTMEICFKSKNTDYCPTLDKVVISCLEELKAYRDAEEQGLLLRLPCKDVYESSGDTVYYIFDYEIAECINCGISIDAEGNIFIHLACDEHIFPYRNLMAGFDTDPTDCCLNTTTVSIDEWGKTVFLTKEEAEQKLAEGIGGE